MFISFNHRYMSEHPSEQTYASDLKEKINQIIIEDGLSLLPAKVEIIKEKKRADILLYDKNNNCILIIEVKLPNELPSNSDVVKQAYDYSQQYKENGLKYFATHNVNLLILYDAMTGQKVDQFSVTYIKELDEYYRKIEEIKENIRKILNWYLRFLEGEPPKSIDESIIEILSNFINGIASTTHLVNIQLESYIKDNEYRSNFEKWLLDKGWEDPKGDQKKLEEYMIILVKQFLYIYTNKLLFYNVLKEKHQRELPQITLPKDATSALFYQFLDMYFKIAMETSKDYETVFQTNFIDTIPVADDSVRELIKLNEYLSTLEYASIGYDIIGKVFEKLIPPKERHLLGQYFTRADVVDLILGFCIKDSKQTILDPACGSGTFLVRSYYRLKYLNGKLAHSEILDRLWGIDIDKFPAHLATINLAIRDLKEEQNYPNIIYSDFFDIPGPKTDVQIGLQSTMGQWVGTDKKTWVEIQRLDEKKLNKIIPSMHSVVGNPPYTRQEEMGDDTFGIKYKAKLLKTVQADFAKLDIPLRSSIYAYFFPHSARFLLDKSRLGFVCLRSWLDTSYGEKLQKFFLENFKIVAIIESDNERWFPDAQMLPIIIILETCSNKSQRSENIVKFVRLKKQLSEIVPIISDERNMVQEIYRWSKVDSFVELIEQSNKIVDKEKINYVKKNISLYEDDTIRLIEVKQEYLKADHKWSKYLSAPTAYFKIFNKSKNLLVPLSQIADIRRGYTTGANEFFCLPNKFFTIKNAKNHIILVNNKTKKEEFIIESEFVKPVINKIKPYRTIGNLKSKNYLLMVDKTKQELEKQKKQVLNYIIYGENKIHESRGKVYEGYNKRTTCATRNIWYNLDERKKYAIFSPSIFWARHVIFLNTKYYATDCLDEINSINKKYNKALCAILNSTFQAIMYEFSGRNIENRDKTISNELKIYELKDILTLDIGKISNEDIIKLENALENIIDIEIGFKSLYTKEDMQDKEELDKVIFCKILGFSEKDMNEVKDSLAETVKRRIERLV